MSKTHRVRIGDLVRDLPVRPVAEGLYVAYFNLENDPEVTEEAARRLVEHALNKAPAPYDAVIMPAGKATPLLQAVGRFAKLPIVVAQKKVRPVMRQPVVSHEYESITSGRQSIHLDADDVEKLRGKRVAILDDVVSTAGSVGAIKALLDKIDAEYDYVYAVFTEGGPRPGVLALGNLPFPYPV